MAMFNYYSIHAMQLPSDETIPINAIVRLRGYFIEKESLLENIEPARLNRRLEQLMEHFRTA